MAYATGTGADTQDLLDAIETFAETDCGFTVEKSATGILMLSQGQCNIAIEPGAVSRPDYTTGVNVPYTDAILKADLATTLNTALDTYWGHPGGLATSDGDADRVEANGLTGPYVAWHLYGGTGFCHVVVQVSALRYAHFGFGNVDKGSLTHSGAGYATGMSNDITPTNTVNPKYFDTLTRGVYGYLSQADNDAHSYGCGTRLFVPDGVPTANKHLIQEQDGSNFVKTMSVLHNARTDYENQGDFYGNRVRRGAPTQFGNRTVLFPIPVIAVDSGFGYYLGQLPEVRYVSMEGLTAGQEVTFASDTWQVFPVKQQNAWGTSANNKNNSLQYGYAFKKVV